MTLERPRTNTYTKEDWLTPKYILDACGDFDLDPCCNSRQPFKTASRMIVGVHDPDGRNLIFGEYGNGMNMEWTGRVWCNPPYGKMMTPWVTRCRLHGNCVMLIPVSTDTQVWHREVFPFASEICFIERRIEFLYPGGGNSGPGNPSGSALIGFGEQCLPKELGYVVTLR